MRIAIAFLIFFMSLCGKLAAQHYQALHGSEYAGGIAVDYNPSAITSSPKSWDLTLVGVQTLLHTNLIDVYKSTGPTKLKSTLLTNGVFDRKLFNSSDVNLLNFRKSFKNKQAYAIGVNFHSVSSVSTSIFNYQDTVIWANSFFKINKLNQPLSAHIHTANWIELYLTYAKTILNTKKRKLDIGLTVKRNKGLASVMVDAYNGQFSEVVSQPDVYYFTSADLKYGYSHTLELNANKNYVKQLFKNAQGGVSVDFGFQYLFKKSDDIFQYENEISSEYSWKIGLSAMDIGYSKYNYGLQSMTTSGVKPIPTGISFEDKFDNTVQTLKIFNDSLTTLTANSSHLYGSYKFRNPSRLILNIDKKITKNIFLNSELVFSLSTPLKGNNYQTGLSNALIFTPRFETQNLGIYFPLSISDMYKKWAGLAFKMGPILVGIHNLNMVRAKKGIQNGGGYLALTLSPYEFAKKLKHTNLKCPSLPK